MASGRIAYRTAPTTSWTSRFLQRSSRTRSMRLGVGLTCAAGPLGTCIRPVRMSAVGIRLAFRTAIAMHSSLQCAPTAAAEKGAVSTFQTQHSHNRRLLGGGR